MLPCNGTESVNCTYFPFLYAVPDIMGNSLGLLPPANEVWGKVMFSQVFVCPQGEGFGFPARITGGIGLHPGGGGPDVMGVCIQGEGAGCKGGLHPGRRGCASKGRGSASMGVVGETPHQN